MNKTEAANQKNRLFEAEFLSKTAQELLEMEYDDDFFTYVCNTVNSLVENAAVLVSSFDPEKIKFKLEAIGGIDEHEDKIFELLQGSPLGLSAFLEIHETQDLVKQKLVKSSLDFKTHVRGALDDTTRQMIEELIGISDIYVMGFSRNTCLPASIAFMANSKCEGVGVTISIASHTSNKSSKESKTL